MGINSAPVPVKKHSSALNKSYRVRFGSETGTPPFRARSITTARVIPYNAPAESGGVNIWPDFTMKMLSPVHSATKPWAFNMIASSQPALFASILARMLFK